jgi:hypothetical protein
MTQSIITEADGLEIARFLHSEIIKEWRAQGHHMTGKFETVLREEISKIVNGISIKGYGVDYAKYIENYLPAGKVPFTLGSGAKKSKFIDALIGYAKARGMATAFTECKSIAFAIAVTQKKEGRSTNGAYRFSSVGRRHGVIEHTLFGVNVQRYIKNWIDKSVENSVNNLIKKAA